MFSGWDDPRLHTIAALRGRGFRGKGFHEVGVVAGLSKSDIRFSMESLETANRRIIDPEANRYMVVFEPVKQALKGYENRDGFVYEPVHPDFPKRGRKKMPVDAGGILISGEDHRKLKGKTFRLKGLANVRLSGRSAAYAGDELERSMQKIEWVSGPGVRVELVMPEGGRLVVKKGIGEQAMSGLKRKVYRPDRQAQAVYAELYALYKQLHDGFGTEEWRGTMNNVMKDLLAIRTRVRT